MAGNGTSLSEQLKELFTGESVLKQVHPAFRLLMLIVLSFVFLLHSGPAVAIFVAVFIVISFIAPFNLLSRPLLFVVVLLVSLISLLVQRFYYDQALSLAAKDTLQFGVRLFVLLAIGVFFGRVLSYHDLTQLFRGSKLLNRMRPAALSFVRVLAEVPAVARSIYDVSNARRYRLRPVVLPRLWKSLGLRLDAVAWTCLQFIAEYSDTIALRGASSTAYRPFSGKDALAKSFLVSIIILILLMVFYFDQMGQI